MIYRKSFVEEGDDVSELEGEWNKGNEASEQIKKKITHSIIMA